MLAGVTPFGLHRLPVIYRAFGTTCANCYIIVFYFKFLLKKSASLSQGMRFLDSPLPSGSV